MVLLVGTSVTAVTTPAELNIERLSDIVNELLNLTTDDLDPSLILQNFVKHPLPINNFTVPVAGVKIRCFEVLVHGLNTVQINEASLSVCVCVCVCLNKLNGAYIFIQGNRRMPPTIQGRTKQ